MKKLLFIVLGLVACVGVKAQQVCRDNIHVSTPTAEFTFHGDGTVTHERTGLMWKQCLEGQAGADCSEGTASLFNWSAALQHAKGASFAGHGDWRLPSIRELTSIVEERCANPAINLEVFPANPGEIAVWSSSAETSSVATLNAWRVEFHQGTSVPEAASYFSEKGRSFGARRGGLRVC